MWRSFAARLLVEWLGGRDAAAAIRATVVGFRWRRQDGRMKGSMPVEAPRSPISGWDELCNIRTDESKRQRSQELERPTKRRTGKRSCARPDLTLRVSPALLTRLDAGAEARRWGRRVFDDAGPSNQGCRGPARRLADRLDIPLWGRTLGSIRKEAPCPSTS